MPHYFIKKENPFHCYSTIDSLKCFKCPNFKTHKLVDLKEHFKAGHPRPEKLYDCPNKEGRTQPEKFDKLYDCPNCTFQTYSRYLYLRHKLSYLCKTSLKVKTEVIALERTNEDENVKDDLSSRPVLQVYTTEGKNLLQCQHCSYTSQDKFDFNRHVRRQHGDPKRIKWFSCDPCSYKTKYTRDLRKHFLSKHTNLDHILWCKCEHCPYQCKTKGDLKVHIDAKHSDRANFRCDQCSFHTKAKRNLKKHMKRKHSDRNKMTRFRCELCPFETLDKWYLPRHALYKHGTKTSVKCDLCPFVASSRTTLTKHVSSKHTPSDKSKTWFSCTNCSYKTPIRGYMKAHLYQHL